MITLTVLICILFAMRVQKKHILTIDGFFAIAGCSVGLVITSINLIYSNNYLITIGPLVSIASIVYLRFRDKILSFSDLNLNYSLTTIKISRMMFWAFILIALASYYTSPLYGISIGFYIGISLAVAALGLEIISVRSWDKNAVAGVITKILLASLIFRASAIFISSYPIGSDPWVHAEIIESMMRLGSINISKNLSATYPFYPLMHLYAISGILLGGYSTKVSMFIVGSVIALSTIFVYLLVKWITNTEVLALLSMLLLNFADFNIQWSETVIAMSFGIAIYSLLMYLVLTKRKNEKLDVFFIVFIFAVVVITHTVSAFIALVSVISLYLGTLAYRFIYGPGGEKPLVNYKVCILLIIVLLSYWAYGGNNFFWTEFTSLVYALTSQAEFLGRSDITMVRERLDSILNIMGFLILIFFGVIGSLIILSKKYLNISMVMIVFMSIVLFSIFFAFPIMGIRTIVPFRWPAFIYVGFVVLTAIGLMGNMTLIKDYPRAMATIFMALLFIFTFFMTTNDIVCPPTPVLGSKLSQPLFWTESEMASFKIINDSYDGIIMSDLQTYNRPFQVYLNRVNNTSSLSITPSGNISWEDMSHDLFVWRKATLTNLVQALLGDQHPDVFLGQEFKDNLDENFSSIYDAGTTKGYLKSPAE